MEQKKSKKSDGEIVALIQAGNVNFFEFLINRYKEKIKRYARKFLSETEDVNDIVQEIFIKVYINIQSFDTKRKFSSWLYRIAHNELVNALKKKKKNILPLFDFDTFLPRKLQDDSFREQIYLKDTRKMIDKCLDRVELKYREPIILYYLEELSYQEISEVMRIPISTVGTRIKRGKKKMKSIFKKLGYTL